jgi:serine/threonine protein kinase/Tfp pilus assembly protein PilF
MPPESQQPHRVSKILQTLGKVYLENGQYAEAIEKFAQLLKLGSHEPEVYRNLALAYAGLKSYAPEAQRAYAQALEKFPNDKTLCLEISPVLLQNGAEDELAQRCYEATLAYHPPFEKALYLHLHQIFRRRKQFDETFQTLKQAIYLDENINELLLKQLVDLGWRYGRLHEVIVTLRFLSGYNEENQVVRRFLAFSLAHAAILHRKKSNSTDLPFRSEEDFQLLHEFLPSPSSLTTLRMVKDYCLLRLALPFSELPVKLRPISRAHDDTDYTVSPAKFEYRSLLEEMPLEELLANFESTRQRPIQEMKVLSTSADEYDWQRDVFDHLPAVGNSPQDLSFARSLLVCTFDHLEEATPDQDQASSSSIQKFIHSAAQHFASTCAPVRVYTFCDGLLAFAQDPQKLAIAAVELLQKNASYNFSLPERTGDRILLKAALHAFHQLSKGTPDEDNIAGLELMSHVLHLAEAEILETSPSLNGFLKIHPQEEAKLEGQNDVHREAQSHLSVAGCGRLLMNRYILESELGRELLPTKFWKRVYLGAPNLEDEIFEVIWYNPLDYLTAKQPVAIGRFRVIEKLKEWRTYGAYRARDRLLERPVILKALHPEIYSSLREDEARYAELMQALRRIGRLEHPGIAIIYDFGARDDLFYFVREYIDGENLFQLLSIKPELSPNESVRLMINVCRILQYAHQHEVYHHNLKPENIWLPALNEPLKENSEPTSNSVAENIQAGSTLTLISRNELSMGRSASLTEVNRLRLINEVKISDFFTPGFHEPTNLTNRLRPATPNFLSKQHYQASARWYYTAPERLNREKNNLQRGKPSAWNAAADVFSLGVILYECLFPDYPFSKIAKGKSEPSSWDDLDIIPPSIIDKNLPQICDDIIFRAIHQDPRERFQTMREFEAALRIVLAELERKQLIALGSATGMAVNTNKR